MFSILFSPHTTQTISIIMCSIHHERLRFQPWLTLYTEISGLCLSVTTSAKTTLHNHNHSNVLQHGTVRSCCLWNHLFYGQLVWFNDYFSFFFLAQGLSDVRTCRLKHLEMCSPGWGSPLSDSISRMESLSALIPQGVCLQLFSSQDKLAEYKPLGHFRLFCVLVKEVCVPMCLCVLFRSFQVNESQWVLKV